MKRRDFLCLVGAAAATWPVALRAQSSRVYRIGFLSPGSFALSTNPGDADEIVQELAKNGFKSGMNLEIIKRQAEAHFE